MRITRLQPRTTDLCHTTTRGLWHLFGRRCATRPRLGAAAMGSGASPSRTRPTLPAAGARSAQGMVGRNSSTVSRSDLGKRRPPGRADHAGGPTPFYQHPLRLRGVGEDRQAAPFPARGWGAVALVGSLALFLTVAAPRPTKGFDPMALTRTLLAAAVAGFLALLALWTTERQERRTRPDVALPPIVALQAISGVMLGAVLVGDRVRLEPLPPGLEIACALVLATSVPVISKAPALAARHPLEGREGEEARSPVATCSTGTRTPAYEQSNS